MIKFENLILEAKLTSDLAKMKFYHGTENENAAKNILQNGIKPNMKQEGRGWAKPVTDRIYMTSDLSYALIYALGANMVGDDLNMEIRSGKQRYNELQHMVEKTGPYMYIFVVYGNHLTDIQPDEDSVGELLVKSYEPYTKIKLPWLEEMAQKYLAPSTIRKAYKGEVIYQIKAGNVLVKRMYDWQKLELINLGAHIASLGEAMPDECWRFLKSRNQELKKDGSNFFQLAERIK